MRLTKHTPPLHKNLPVPAAKWQTGDYAPVQEFRFNLPIGFLMLCRLWDTTPNELLMDFMDNLSCGHRNRQHRDKAKQHLWFYIYEMAYGQQKYYTLRDIKQMFTELDAIGRLVSKMVYHSAPPLSKSGVSRESVFGGESVNETVKVEITFY